MDKKTLCEESLFLFRNHVLIPVMKLSSDMVNSRLKYSIRKREKDKKTRGFNLVILIYALAPPFEFQPIEQWQRTLLEINSKITNSTVNLGVQIQSINVIGEQKAKPNTVLIKSYKPKDLSKKWNSIAKPNFTFPKHSQ